MQLNVCIHWLCGFISEPKEVPAISSSGLLSRWYSYVAGWDYQRQGQVSSRRTRDKRLIMLHVICTRLRPGLLSVRVGGSSRRREEIVNISIMRLSVRLLLLLLLLLLFRINHCMCDVTIELSPLLYPAWRYYCSGGKRFSSVLNNLLSFFLQSLDPNGFFFTRKTNVSYIDDACP